MYAIVSMLTEQELDEAMELAQEFREHETARKIRERVPELYGSVNAAGFLEVKRQTAIELDYPLFWDGLCRMLGINR